MRALLLLSLLQQGPPPAPSSGRAAMIGEYSRGGSTTLMILERGGEMYARFDSLRESRLTRTVLGQWLLRDSAAEPGTLTFLVNSESNRIGELRYAGATWRRIALGPSAGNVFRIKPVRPVETLRREALAASPPLEQGDFRPTDLLELVRLDSTIKLDIRYASTRNFLGTPVYTQARAFLQHPAAEALVRAHHWLKTYGLGLLIHDGYRPWYVTKIFWDATPPAQHEFVADPATGSRHNRGCAVDLTLYDLATGQVIEMPGVYDEMSHRSYPGYAGGTSRQRWYRDLLRRAMEAEGFSVNPSEWWHFDYKDWKSYRIGNTPFEKL